MSDTGEKKRTFTEEIELAGAQLVDGIKDLFAKGNVRQLRIKSPTGEVYLETPLTVGVLGGGAVVLAAPWLAMIAALAGLVAKVKVEVVRDEEPPSTDDPAI